MQPSRRCASTKGSIIPRVVAASRIHLSERIAISRSFSTSSRGASEGRGLSAEPFRLEPGVECGNMIKPGPRLAQQFLGIADLEPCELRHAAHEMDAVARIEIVVLSGRIPPAADFVRHAPVFSIAELDRE